ncbi:2Fe-2S iron-sulfur cluster binding domain-containing protein [Polyangium sp. 15x6]|uniref:2Fe-2S iron-sulfur cluster binding domain-containing protein n=1 Tax=Polyangium sp. 15x6 TaxID=3042687 RepID=UPI00249CACAD|nr:2Fe-2S iron-sulfur cluster binding domain-containing protein [Polyangium sp. 15x6]MDI3286075.1 2Fe-2S iron-sulfur cluster binding domain-containing protein [Polyangium sp. 15x6]
MTMFGLKSSPKQSGRGGALHIAGSDRVASIAAGETLLGAAVREDIPFPRMCNVGECGACKCRLTRGHVRLKKDISLHVSPEELSSGFILACQSVAESAEVEVEVLGAGDDDAGKQAPRKMDASITQMTMLTPDVCELELSLAVDIDYVAGQYAQLTVPGVMGLDEPRCYSFAEAPTGRSSKRRAIFHIRHVPGGAFTGWLFAADRTGDRLCLSGPHGGLCYREAERPLLCVAAGTGLAPIKAILEQGLAEGFTHDVTLVVGARTRRDLYAIDSILAIQERWHGSFAFVPVLSQESEDSAWRGRRGRVTDYLREREKSLADCAAYLCGPPAMIDSALEVLRHRIPPKHLHHDRFLDRGSIATAASAVA